MTDRKRALVAIAEAQGVTFRYKSPVARILVDGQRATGVQLADGEQLEADVVIANADLPYVCKSLLPEDGPARACRGCCCRRA